jgi:molybdate transport system substrate-binding protein
MNRRHLLRHTLMGGLCLASATAALAQDANLLIYCGITMVRPITELARSFEQREKVTVQISQGGSEDLYQSARKSRVGDIYFPGEPSYRDKYLPEGLLGAARLVGYNQLALFVAKGNPKKVKPELSELMRKDLVLTLGNAQSGSVGQETKQTLDRYNLYPKAVAKAAFLMPDSRSLNLSMKRGDADITLNWRATAFFPDNAPFVELVDLDPKVAQPQGLLLNELTFSKQPALARKFIDYAASPEGQAVFRKWGFMDASGKR